MSGDEPRPERLAGEWSHPRYEGDIAYRACPVCKSLRTWGHVPGCVLDAALSDLAIAEQLRADLAAARAREAALRATLREIQERATGGWSWRQPPAPPAPQPASSEPTPTPTSHSVTTAQTLDGWASRCSCGWLYENTSAALAEQAGVLHQDGFSIVGTPVGGDAEVIRLRAEADRRLAEEGRTVILLAEQPAASTPSGEGSSDGTA